MDKVMPNLATVLLVTDLLTRAVPAQTWPQLPGRAVGMLVQSPTGWGEVGWLSPFGRSTTSNGNYVFVAGESIWVVYFVSSGEGRPLLRNWRVPLPGGKKAVFDAAQFDPTTPNPWGLGARAHLVEVEVNGGDGAASGPHFVITDVKIDPFDLTAALDAARGAFDGHARASKKQIAKAMAKAAKDPSAAPVGKETEVVQEAWFPRWDADRRRLRVTFVRWIVRSSEKREKVGNGGNCRRGGRHKRVCPPPDYERVVARHAYGVELGAEVEIDEDGKVVKVTKIPAAPIFPDQLVDRGFAMP